MQVRTPTHPAASAAFKATLAGMLLAGLAACGGGGGGGGGASASGAPAAASSATAADSTGGATASDGSGSSAATPSAAQLARTDFQVNATAAGDQDSAVVAPLAGGGFVAVWASDAVSPARNVRLQRYDAQLQPAGGEVVVAAGFAPSVAALPDGGFVVTWSDAPYQYVANGWWQRFDAQGAPAGAPVQIAATSYKYVTRATALADGSVVVAADTIAGKYGAGFGTLTRYGADGAALGAPVELTSALDAPTGGYDTNTVFDVTTTALPGGGFVAAWIAAGRSQSELRVASFDAQGAQLGGVTTLDARAALRSPSLASLPGGGYALAWQAIEAQGATAWVEVFDGAGHSLGRQVLASDAAASQLEPRVAATADGGFVVAWRDARFGSTSLDRQVLAQRFGATGTPAGAAEAIGQVSVPTAGRSNFNDSIAVAPAGSGFLVLHGGFGAASGWDVLAARR